MLRAGQIVKLVSKNSVSACCYQVENQLRSGNVENNGRSSEESFQHIAATLSLIERRVSGDSRWRVSDPLPPSAALPLTEGENKISNANLILVRGRRERSERGGGSHAILNGVGLTRHLLHWATCHKMCRLLP